MCGRFLDSGAGAAHFPRVKTDPPTRETDLQERTEGWDTGGADPGALHRALAGHAAYAGVAPADLEPMRTKGLVHAHVRIRGTGAVLRVPRLGSFGLSPADNLAYQAECFRRAGPSGHVPDIFAVLSPDAGLPWGALVISEIAGATPALPRDLPAIARALAAIHALDVPRETLRPPLPSHGDPVAATVAVIEAQAGFLARAGLVPDALRQIGEEVAWARGLAAEAAGADHPVTLVGTDTHPGNFMVRQCDGEAIFVDMEKMLYGAPAIDLAHASVYTSTMWDADVATALSPAEVACCQQVRPGPALTSITVIYV